MGYDKDSKSLFNCYKLIREQSVVAMDPNHFDYSDPYWQTPEGKAERANREQRYNAMAQGQQQSTNTTNRTVDLKPDDTSFKATLNQMGNAISNGISWDNIKKDLGGLFKDKPAPQPSPTPAPATNQQQAQQPITPTKADLNSPGLDTSALDKAAQAVLQQNPNFNADAVAQRFKDNIKANIETLASIGMSQEEIQKRIQPEIQRLANHIPDYANTPQYQTANNQTSNDPFQSKIDQMNQQTQQWQSNTGVRQVTPSPSQPTSTAQMNQQFNTTGSTTPSPQQSTAQYLPQSKNKYFMSSPTSATKSY